MTKKEKLESAYTYLSSIAHDKERFIGVLEEMTESKNQRRAEKCLECEQGSPYGGCFYVNGVCTWVPET